MKKLLILLAVLCTFGGITASALEAPDLVFTPEKNGKYIYCNNREFILRQDLADHSNERPKFIMNNEDLTPDKYALFISHVNHTDVRSADGWSITQEGFDIEVDAVFQAKEDTTIRLTAVGFEVPENRKYYLNGKSYTAEEQWGCFTAWASYLQLPVSEIDSGQKYNPVPFSPVEFTVKKGERVWLSDYIPNYSTVPYYRPIHILADFEILSGKADVNIAALKSTGTLRDRSNFVPDAAFGSYVFEHQHKGIADSLNIVNAELSFTIDDNVWGSTLLPVKVYNQYAPEGNEITTWFTNLNPRSDIWSKDIVAESCMLDFAYKDDSKLNYYGKSVPKDLQDNIWKFDTRHADVSAYPGPGTGFSSSNYVPNYELKPGEGETYAASLGNFGVFQNYTVHITNNGNYDRYVNYNLNTGSNNLIILRDESGNLVEPYPITKGYCVVKERDTLVSLKLPAKQTTTFTFTVILTTNYSGGMENRLVIDDTPSPVKTYQNSAHLNVKDSSFTGREYIKWEKEDLYTSFDKQSWTKVPLSTQTKKIFNGQWHQFQFLWTGKGYLAKSTIYDGIPYYTVRDFFRTVYLLDDQFNLIASHQFSAYPTAMAVSGDTYYVTAGSTYTSKDFKEWTLSNGLPELPVYNYGPFSAALNNGSITVSTDGKAFYPVAYENRRPPYIDSLGDYYYYVDGKEIYLSKDGISFVTISSPETVASLGITKDSLLVNGELLLPLPEIEAPTTVKLKDTFLGFQTPPMLLDGITYVPLRFLAQQAGAKVTWNADTQTAAISKGTTAISMTIGNCRALVNGKESALAAAPVLQNGTSYVPLRFLAETLGYQVIWNSEKNLVEIK